MKGGMQSSVASNFYCPVCSKPVSVISDGLIKHILKNGTVLYCSVEKNIKRKKSIKLFS